MSGEGGVYMSSADMVETLPTDQLQNLSPEELEQMDDRTLLRLYKDTGNNELKWMLVLRFTELIRKIAAQTCGLYSSFAQLDDIINEGVIVLLNAVDKFDLSKDVKFETYVSKRLRGMIVDLARRQDWLPRQVRQKAVKLNRAVDELSMQLGRVPENEEVAQHLGISKEQYEEMLSDTAVSNLVSFEAALDSYGNTVEGMLAREEHSNPIEEICQEHELHEMLEKGIAMLRKNEQMVLMLYYKNELNMKEIAQVMGVSAPRVSQIHSRALQHLRVYMKQYMES